MDPNHWCSATVAAVKDQGMTMMTMEFIYISSYNRIYIHNIIYITYVYDTHVDSIYTSDSESERIVDAVFPQISPTNFFEGMMFLSFLWGCLF